VLTSISNDAKATASVATDDDPGAIDAASTKW